jgi:prolyl-tRNA editing enzyme YbaK/EbsC (Cys-tRNA(Pro) deacylase)
MTVEERVVAAASARGLDIEVRAFPQGTRTAEDAAGAIGCDVSQIVKSLVFMVDGEPVVALVAGPDRLDEEKLAEAAGGARVRRATGDEVRAATGFVIGGVPPFGHATTLRCFVDRALLDHDTVWAAAGTPTHVFAAEPTALASASGAATADLRVGPRPD